MPEAANTVPLLAVQQLNASKKVWGDLGATAAIRPCRCVEEIVAAAVITDRLHGPLQQQHCVHTIGMESPGEPGLFPFVL